MTGASCGPPAQESLGRMCPGRGDLPGVPSLAGSPGLVGRGFVVAKKIPDVIALVRRSAVAPPRGLSHPPGYAVIDASWKTGG